MSHIEIILPSSTLLPSPSSNVSKTQSICDTNGLPSLPLQGFQMSQQGFQITHEALSPKKLCNKHRWTVQETVVHCVLRRWYLNRWDDFAAIMNIHFQHDGVTKSPAVFSGRTISAYWHTIRLKDTAGVWTTVYADISFQNPLAACMRLLHRLKAHANQPGIAIVCRAEEQAGLQRIPVLPSSRISFQSSAGFDMASPSQSDTLTAVKQEDDGGIPILFQNISPAPIVTPPQSPTSHPTSGRPMSAFKTCTANIPRLLFRRWNEASAGIVRAVALEHN